MTNTWVYVCDRPRDIEDPEEGLLYVARTDRPDSVTYSEDNGWCIPDPNVWWYEVDRKTLKVKHSSDDIYAGDNDYMEWLAEALLLELSGIPVPTYKDTHPTIVIQKINHSETYYTEE